MIEEGTTEPRSNLHRLLRSGEFVVTAELQTTDSAEPDTVHHLVDTLRGHVDAVNCTDNSSAHPHIAPLAAASALRMSSARLSHGSSAVPRRRKARRSPER